MTKLQLPKLHKTVVKTFLIINISNSNKLNKFWVGIFTSHTSHQSSLLNRSESVSESVSEWQALPMIGLGSDNYSSELQMSRSWIRIVFSILLLEGRKLQNLITEWKKGVHVLLGCDWVRDGSDWAKSLGTTDSTPNRLLQYQGSSCRRTFSLSAVLRFNLFKL